MHRSKKEFEECLNVYGGGEIKEWLKNLADSKST